MDEEPDPRRSPRPFDMAVVGIVLAIIVVGIVVTVLMFIDRLERAFGG